MCGVDREGALHEPILVSLKNTLVDNQTYQDIYSPGSFVEFLIPCILHNCSYAWGFRLKPPLP